MRVQTLRVKQMIKCKLQAKTAISYIKKTAGMVTKQTKLSLIITK
jgi:hypothetical protein